MIKNGKGTFMRISEFLITLFGIRNYLNFIEVYALLMAIGRIRNIIIKSLFGFRI